ncbi:MAG TPA: P-loop NTPase [Candidatus Polarisedimenticolia bacterium]|nr:P-loop NTPase [Candidatus Polarisedimenticolia bacterium]
MTPRSSLFLISSRPAFLADLERVLAGAAGPALAGRAGMPGGSMAAAEALRSGAATAVLLDVDSDPAESLRVMESLLREVPDARILAASAQRDPDVILQAMRAGAADFLGHPIDRAALEESLARVARRGGSEGPASPARGRVVSFVSAKGGCGATTVAANLSVALASHPGRQGKSLILVDLDSPGGDVSAMLQIDPAYSLADVSANAHRLDMDLLNSMLTRHESGAMVLASAAEGENGRPLESLGPERMTAIVEFLREHFDTVVLAGGGLGEAELAALNQAHLVHLVTTLDFLALRRAHAMIERLRAFGVTGDALRVVINRLDRGAELTVSDARQALEAPVVWSIPSDARTAEHAVNEGVPFVMKGKGRLQASFEEYANLLAGPATGSSAGIGSIFRRLVPGRAAITG